MAKQTKQVDFTLDDGTEITFDLRKLTRAEFKGLFDPSVPMAESERAFSRTSGITTEKLNALTITEYQRLFDAFLKKTREPLAADA